MPAGGFINTFEKIIVWELPLVTLLLSGTEEADMLTPGFKLIIVKVPKTNPVFISWDCIIAWLEDRIELTIKVVLNVFAPPLALITAEPITSPEVILEISKEPKSDANNEVAISGSLGSWLTLIVKSVKLSQSILESETETVGEKGIQATLPVLPPTQFPQLSVNEVPPNIPSQSKHSIVSIKDWLSTSPSSELIIDVKFNTLVSGFVNNPFNKIVWLFPLVTLLLSGEDVATTKIPPLAFSIVNEPYIWLVALSTALTEILSRVIIKSTIKVVLTFIYPPPAIKSADPITSLEFNPVKLKNPASEEKIDEEMSGSFASWLVTKVMSDRTLHSIVLKAILTDGVKSIHATSPVVPPTQFPQLSINAVPFGVLLQSTG